jgi:hypothetical protein
MAVRFLSCFPFVAAMRATSLCSLGTVNFLGVS